MRKLQISGYNLLKSIGYKPADSLTEVFKKKKKKERKRREKKKKETK